VWFVDAFAGAGCDETGNPGSPLISAQVADAINTKYFPNGLTAHTGMRVVAFEEEPEFYENLVKVMASYTAPARRWPEAVAIVKEGTLEHHLDRMLETFRDAPVLYFLDPFGIDGLDAAALSKLFGASKAVGGNKKELLLLFSDEGAVRHAGKIRAGLQDEDAVIAAAAASVSQSIFGEEDTERARQEKIAAAKRQLAGHKSNADSDAIMTRAFGGDWWKPIIDATPDRRRQAKFVELYERLLLQHGATKCLHFSVDTKVGRHKYFLIHASAHPSAFVAMKDAMHRTRTQHLAEQEGLIGQAQPENDIRAIADVIARQFAGRQVRWTGVTVTVQEFALKETALWRYEFDALKAELLRRGVTDLNANGRPRKPMSFTFPADPAATDQQ
jgi:three-Cys-motif partner protein